MLDFKFLYSFCRKNSLNKDSTFTLENIANIIVIICKVYDLF